VTLFYSQFDVLRIVIVAPDSDQIFEAARNEQFALPHEAQISSAQKRALPSIKQVGSESVRGLLGPLPVALGYTRARHPDLAYLSRRTPGQGFGINDHDFLV
jgi:hypothetical protein